jgi:hypothetical protein
MRLGVFASNSVDHGVCADVADRTGFFASSSTRDQLSCLPLVAQPSVCVLCTR